MTTLNQTGLPDLLFRRSKMIRRAIALIQSLTVILAVPAANAQAAPAQFAVPEWVRVYNGPGNGDDYPVAIAMDTSGNVIVSGHSRGSARGPDYTTIKYSGAGMPPWTNRYNWPANGSDTPRAIAVDTSGNVIVTGSSWNGTNYDYGTIKHSVPRPLLAIERAANQLVLSWTDATFILQSAGTVSAAFTNLFGATSPWTKAINGGRQYFRLISKPVGTSRSAPWLGIP